MTYDGEERRSMDEPRRNSCKDCPLVGGFCTEHALLSAGWKWRNNVVLGALMVLLAGTGGLLLRVGHVGGKVDSASSRIDAHIGEYERFSVHTNAAAARLWEDIRDLRDKSHGESRGTEK